MNQLLDALIRFGIACPISGFAICGSIPVATVFNVNRNKRLLAVSYRTTGSRV